MNKRKICVVITARPSYSRVKTALQAIKDHPELDLQLVVAASALLDKYGSTVEYILNDGFEIASKVFMVMEGGGLTSMAKTTGIGILELATTFDNLKPDMVVSIADRFETMATAVAASYMNIPLVHLQGGEVTGNIDEKVRHAVTKLSDLHLVSTERARERVIKMGEEPDRVIVTGCPSIDLAREVYENPVLDFDPLKKYGGVGAEISATTEDYVVVMQHPVTTVPELAKEHILLTLKVIKELNTPAFWFWPNMDAGSDGTSKGIRTFREQNKNLNIRFFKNMEGKDFLKLLKNSKCLIGNSSAGIRECSFLGVPVVNIGTRQNRRDRGQNVLDVSHEFEAIKAAIIQQAEYACYPMDQLYGDGMAGERIADALGKGKPEITKHLTY